MNAFTWLALDPALTDFGWALFVDDGSQVLVSKLGIWHTEKAEELRRKKGQTQKPGVVKDTAKRVATIAAQISDVVQRETPVAIFVESLAMPFGRTGMLTVSTLGRIRGVIEGVALVLGVPVIEFNSSTVKAALTGRRDAEKADVGKRVEQLYPEIRIQLPPGRIAENITDAVAIGHLGRESDLVRMHRDQRDAHGDGLRLNFVDAVVDFGLEVPCF